MRKALMDAYARQISPGEYPFVVLMLDIDPKMVDVNVHPSKLQVKFADSKLIYQVVYDTIASTLGGNKIAQQYVNYQSKAYRPSEQTSQILDQVVQGEQQLFSVDSAAAPEVKSVMGLESLVE